MDIIPARKKAAIKKHVEADLGSMLEDLVVAVWQVHALTLHEPDGELHKMTVGIINTFELHEFGWQKSKLIPDSFLFFEGDDTTLDERITQYIALARKHRDDLRQSLVMMLAAVFIRTRDDTNGLMHQWVLQAMHRHRVSKDSFGSKSTEVSINYVPPTSDKLQ